MGVQDDGMLDVHAALFPPAGEALANILLGEGVVQETRGMVKGTLAGLRVEVLFELEKSESCFHERGQVARHL